ncbi:MAG TPA: transposase [Chloroflexi bacterium]|nr:transposase [Chloroflexota bacterium]
MIPINYTTLAEALCDMPAPRNERGRSYEWEYLWLVIAAAMCTGEKTLKGIRSLEQAEQLRRWHWTIENVVHYPRDVSFGEDHCQVRSGNAPQSMAALRNAIASILRSEGWTALPVYQMASVIAVARCKQHCV